MFKPRAFRNSPMWSQYLGLPNFVHQNPSIIHYVKMNSFNWLKTFSYWDRHVTCYGVKKVKLMWSKPFRGPLQRPLRSISSWTWTPGRTQRWDFRSAISIWRRNRRQPSPVGRSCQGTWSRSLDWGCCTCTQLKRGIETSNKEVSESYPFIKWIYIFKKGQPRPLFRLFSVFLKQTIQFLQQTNVKNVQMSI